MSSLCHTQLPPPCPALVFTQQFSLNWLLVGRFFFYYIKKYILKGNYYIHIIGIDIIVVGLF
jgi:hypothetical protein